MRHNYNTKSVTLRVPDLIYQEIQKRITDDVQQTDVILNALCRAFEIERPRPPKKQVETEAA